MDIAMVCADIQVCSEQGLLQLYKVPHLGLGPLRKQHARAAPDLVLWRNSSSMMVQWLAQGRLAQYFGWHAVRCCGCGTPHLPGLPSADDGILPSKMLPHRALTWW